MDNSESQSISGGLFTPEANLIEENGSWPSATCFHSAAVLGGTITILWAI
jgi:hypothetical protein